jgi:hypothetical protein
MLAGFAPAGVATRRARTPGVLLAALTLLALGCVGFILGDGLPAYLVPVEFGIGSPDIGSWFGGLRRARARVIGCPARFYCGYC